MLVEMTPKYAEYERHKGERFECNGKTYTICGTKCYKLEGYGFYAMDGLRVVRKLGIEVQS